MGTQLEVTYEPVERLKGYANNAKVHTRQQIRQIKDSIREFGFNDPIGVWTNAEGKSEIVEGHGRFTAACEMGFKELPVIHLDGLTDEQRRAYTHVHNQLTLATDFEADALRSELAEVGDILDGYDFDFGITEPEQRPVIPQPAPESAPQVYEGERFDFLFVCHTAEEQEWLAQMLGGTLRKVYEAQEVIDAQG